MVLTKDLLFVAGAPDVIDEINLWHNPGEQSLKRKLARQTDALRGKNGGKLFAVATEDGSILDSIELDSPPVFDGMIAAEGRLYLSLISGEILCLGEVTEN